MASGVTSINAESLECLGLNFALEFPVGRVLDEVGVGDGAAGGEFGSPAIGIALGPRLMALLVGIGHALGSVLALSTLVGIPVQCGVVTDVGDSLGRVGVPELAAFGTDFAALIRGKSGGRTAPYRLGLRRGRNKGVERVTSGPSQILELGLGGVSVANIRADATDVVRRIQVVEIHADVHVVVEHPGEIGEVLGAVHVELDRITALRDRRDDVGQLSCHTLGILVGEELGFHRVRLHRVDGVLRRGSKLPVAKI